MKLINYCKRVVTPVHQHWIYISLALTHKLHWNKWYLLSINLLFNSLAPGKFEWNFRYAIFKWISVIGGWGISCEIALIWMSLYFTDDQSTLVQVMAWCHQATSHYLSQCWPRSLSPYGVTRSQWVKYQLITSVLTYYVSTQPDLGFGIRSDLKVSPRSSRSPHHNHPASHHSLHQYPILTTWLS